MLRAGKPQRALRADPRPARCRAVRRRALSAAAMGRHARRRRRHRLHRRLDRRWPARRPPADHRSRHARGQGRQGRAPEARRRRGVRRRDRCEALCLPRRRAAPAPEPRLPGRARARAAAPGLPHHLRPRRPHRGPAQFQQPGADPSEPLPAWLGAVPALASRLSLRVRAEPAGLRPRHHAPLLGLDDAEVSSGRPDQRLHHSAGLQGIPPAGRGRRDDRGAQSETQPGAGRCIPRHGGRARRADAVRLAARVLLPRDRQGRLHGGHARSGEGEQEPRRR